MQLEFFAGTYERINRGTLHFNIQDDRGNHLSHLEIPTDTLADNNWFQIPLDLHIAQSTVLTLTIQAEMTQPDQFITLYSSRSSSTEDNFFKINGEKQGTVLALKLKGIPSIRHRITQIVRRVDWETVRGSRIILLCTILFSLAYGITLLISSCDIARITDNISEKRNKL